MKPLQGVRVAHVVPTDRIACLLLRSRLTRLAEAGCEVEVICGRGGGDDYGALLEEAGLPVRYIPFAREIEPWTDLRCMAALYRTLRRGRYDIVHSHNPKGTLLGPPVGRLARGPVVTHTVHGFLFNENSRGLHRLAALAAERWAARWCDHLLFQSAEDYRYAVEHRFKRPEQLHLVGNGIDERRFDRDVAIGQRGCKRAELGFGEGHLVVGMVARFVAEKGCHEFFEMAGRLARQRDDVRFLAVGLLEREQSDFVDPHEQVQRHGLDGRCTVVEGRPEEMPGLYACMDLAVLPSYREGIPRALLEAGTMGVAMAASDIRGCREVIEDGVSGALFKLKDVEDFCATVERLLDDGDQRRRLATAGRQRILEKYTEGVVAERVVECYRTMLE